MMVKEVEDSVKLQLDLDGLGDWSESWRLNFKVPKCTQMSFCKQTPRFSCTYYINGKPLRAVQKHRDLGLIVSSDLSWHSHHNHLASKAYNMLGLLRRSLCRGHSGDLIMKRRLLYISLVRSQLMYCSQLWRPFHIVDIKRLETIQRRATKFILANYSV